MKKATTTCKRCGEELTVTEVGTARRCICGRTSVTLRDTGPGVMLHPPVGG